MSVDPELLPALEASNAGRTAEAVRLLRPLAEAGHIDAQEHVGLLMVNGYHRFETIDEMNAWCEKATDADLAAFWRDLQPDVEQALQWLHNASDHGIGTATHNLAMAYFSGAGNLSPEKRRARAKELLAKARSQGFTFFGSEEGDEAYLEFIDQYSKAESIDPPRESRTGGEPESATDGES